MAADTPRDGPPTVSRRGERASHVNRSAVDAERPYEIDKPDADSRPRRILVVDPIDEGALDRLRARYDVTVRLRPTEADLRAALNGQDAVILRSGVKVTAGVIAAARNLKVIARAGNGVDNIDLPAAQAAGIQAFNIPGVSSAAVAELALGLTYAVARRIAFADRQIRAGQWKKAELSGTELAGKTMGIVGLGDIGTRLAQLARAVGMTVVASVGNPSVLRSAACERAGITLLPTARLLVVADVVVLACPLTDATRNLIGGAELDRMKPTGLLVNIARGGIVDESALHRALVAGGIAGAALDVLAAEGSPTPLAQLDNVVLTPHIGAMTGQAQERIGQALLDGLALAFDGKDAPNRLC